MYCNSISGLDLIDFTPTPPAGIIYLQEFRNSNTKRSLKVTLNSTAGDSKPGFELGFA